MTVGRISRAERLELAVYRSVLPDLVHDGFELTRGVVRPPVYAPNLVDNLWEWLRPPQFPSRRLSAFASPTPELARQGGAPNGKVYKVSLSGDLKACQVLGCQNSRDHPEAGSLPVLLYERLGPDSLTTRVEQKIPAGRMWLPCVSGSEVGRLFTEVPELRGIRDEAYLRFATGTTSGCWTVLLVRSTAWGRSFSRPRVGIDSSRWIEVTQGRGAGSACRSGVPCRCGGRRRR